MRFQHFPVPVAHICVIGLYGGGKTGLPFHVFGTFSYCTIAGLCVRRIRGSAPNCVTGFYVLGGVGWAVTWDGRARDKSESKNMLLQKVTPLL